VCELTLQMRFSCLQVRAHTQAKLAWGTAHVITEANEAIILSKLNQRLPICTWEQRWTLSCVKSGREDRLGMSPWRVTMS